MPRPQTPSLRAQRSNPDCLRGETLDCFVARAPRNDELGRPRSALSTVIAREGGRSSIPRHQ
ncbi:hypothetical protein EAS62_07395 [Bradyrhizobium zhanjiangense]|uniref:Propionyl-coenzyme A carboxylase alpha polypeptide n=1 Tax=Bradyrhizobium zhanjiangense TaxID=1325107 RepID=A0ABY0DRH4_9BRAD|nr:hypothetical protein EAS62_07395 [Bradyrhizobium zhanjiangense]